MVFDLNVRGLHVLITGGYGYLGKAITESMAHHGATVYVLGREKGKFEETYSTSEYLNAIRFQYADISSAESIDTAVKSISAQVRIDVLINNAFYLTGQSPESMTDKEWESGIDGCLNSVFRCIRAIIPVFRKNMSGKIINVSSMYGIVAPHFEVYNDFPEYLNPPHYGAAKAAIIQLTRYYAAYLGPSGITVNSVTPGPFPSSTVQEQTGFIDLLKENTLLKRIGKPEDLAGIFVFLSSSGADFITGQNFIVDGGWTAK